MGPHQQSSDKHAVLQSLATNSSRWLLLASPQPHNLRGEALWSLIPSIRTQQSLASFLCCICWGYHAIKCAHVHASGVCFFSGGQGCMGQ